MNVRPRPFSAALKILILQCGTQDWKGIIEFNTYAPQQAEVKSFHRIESNKTISFQWLLSGKWIPFMIGLTTEIEFIQRKKVEKNGIKHHNFSKFPASHSKKFKTSPIHKTNLFIDNTKN